jgi:hypothetical protein
MLAWAFLGGSSTRPDLGSGSVSSWMAGGVDLLDRLASGIVILVVLMIVALAVQQEWIRVPWLQKRVLTPLQHQAAAVRRHYRSLAQDLDTERQDTDREA